MFEMIPLVSLVVIGAVMWKCNPWRSRDDPTCPDAGVSVLETEAITTTLARVWGDRP